MKKGDVTTKAITLWQPWASLIAHGVKTIETRSWFTSYRGPLAIHASKRRCSPDAYDLPLYRPGDLGNPATLPLGAVVATCELVDCLLMTDKATPGPSLVLGPPLEAWYPQPMPAPITVEFEDQRLYGDFRRGRYAWVLNNIKPVEPAVPVKGHQGLWNWCNPELPNNQHESEIGSQ